MAVVVRVCMLPSTRIKLGSCRLSVFSPSFVGLSCSLLSLTHTVPPTPSASYEYRGPRLVGRVEPFDDPPRLFR